MPLVAQFFLFYCCRLHTIAALLHGMDEVDFYAFGCIVFFVLLLSCRLHTIAALLHGMDEVVFLKCIYTYIYIFFLMPLCAQFFVFETIAERERTKREFCRIKPFAAAMQQLSSYHGRSIPCLVMLRGMTLYEVECWSFKVLVLLSIFARLLDDLCLLRFFFASSFKIGDRPCRPRGDLRTAR